jgi:ketosteroid isomerase-like protein
MSNDRNVETLKAAWVDLGEGNWDALASAYSEDMIFVLPGQMDVLKGR